MTESQESPVRHFCAQLDAFVRASGQTRSYVVGRHPMSDSQVYAVLAGTVKTPPSFDRMVVPIVEICGGGPAAVAQWRTHHDTMVRVYELQKSLRRKGTATGAPEDAAADAPPVDAPPATPEREPGPGALPGFDVPPGHNRFASAEPRPARRSRRLLLMVAAIVALLGVTAGGVAWALTDRQGSGPAAPPPAAGGDTVAPDPSSPCTATAPAGGGDLLELSLPKGSSPLSRPWWANEPDTVAVERFDTHGWTATVPDSTEAVPGDLLVIRGCLPVTAGHRYRLDFIATASIDATIRARVQHNEDPYPDSLTKDLTVGPSPRSFRYEFTGDVTSPSSELTFQLGGNPAMRVEVTGVVLTDLGA